ncbi:MAG: ABC transporter ATP-binding protein [Eubacteriales bacterium]
MKEKNHGFKLFFRSLRLIERLDNIYLLVLVISAIVTAALPYIPIYFSSVIIDELLSEARPRMLIIYVALTVGLSFLCGFLIKILGKIKSYKRQNFSRKEEMLFSQTAMEMEYAVLEKHSTRTLFSRIKEEQRSGHNTPAFCSSLELVLTNLTQLLIAVFMIRSLFFTVFSLNIGVVTIFAVSIVLSSVVNLLCSQKAQKLILAANEKLVEYDTALRFYSGVQYDYNFGKDIRLYGLENTLTKEHENIWNNAVKHMGKAYRKQIGYNVVSIFFSYVIQLFTYGIVVYSCIAGNLSIGSVTRIISAILLFMGALTNAMKNIQALSVNNKYMENYFAYLDLPKDDQKKSLMVDQNKKDHTIEFCNVYFKYPDSDAYVLKDLSIKIPFNKSLAIVGVNGCGKTTFIKLLCRLYRPSKGKILLDGIDIFEYDYQSYIKLFSTVFQDFKLFALTVKENIAVSDDCDVEKLYEYANKIGIKERIENMPDKENSYLYKNYEESGIEISGGEAQKIALVRALYKDSPFIVLDEPTAALDPKSEYEIYLKFHEFTKGKTAVFISHRLSSCRFCDNIAVFDDGRVVQYGPHEELLKDETGKYSELWSAQAQYYT